MMNPSDSTRCGNFWIDTLKTRYPQGLNNIDPYHQLLLLQFYQFPRQIQKIFILFFFQNSLSTCYFYFPFLLWLGRLLCYPPQKIFSSASLSCNLSACSVVFIHVQLRFGTLFLFILVQSFRKFKLYKRLFVDCLYYNVTELL